ncbi:general odorant-binding protein 28a-like [Calliphora vicina]|uniref:general odorant-binding protein 28a-like n=1 Tax=Calliphora vicina TaxID=7373 RepID=UPI00325BEA29
MKFLVVFTVLVLAACNIRAQLTKVEAIAIATGCKEETGASDADFEAMIKHQPADTKEGKCMRACALKKFGVMSDDGKMLKDAAIELSKSLVKDDDKKELVAGVIEACEGLKVSDDHCEAAEEYGSCLKKEFESKGISSTEDLL